MNFRNRFPLVILAAITSLAQTKSPNSAQSETTAGRSRRDDICHKRDKPVVISDSGGRRRTRPDISAGLALCSANGWEKADDDPTVLKPKGKKVLSAHADWGTASASHTVHYSPQGILKLTITFVEEGGRKSHKITAVTDADKKNLEIRTDPLDPSDGCCVFKKKGKDFFYGRKTESDPLPGYIESIAVDCPGETCDPDKPTSPVAVTLSYP